LDFHAVTVRDAHGIPILDRVDLTLRPGSSVALVGRSGSGKSLLAALAGRLVDPDEGEIVLDGIPLTRLDLHDLRTAVSYAFERPVLVGENLTEVITLGLAAVPPHRVRAAAATARIDHVIDRLPAGYSTAPEDLRLSGGEIQRIGLARAFVRDARLLILDDVAASLDAATEHHISAALTTTMVDRTRLVIAHRASTAARSEIVVWLVDGRIRAARPHRELWEDPEYRAVFEPTATPAPAQGVGVRP
jgi:ATP-binding cassette subfamily B protein